MTMSRPLRSVLLFSAALLYGGTLYAQPPAGPPATGQGGPGGPPPAPVAIPRPTRTEVDQVNAAFERFIAGETSGAQPLLKKYEPLMRLREQRLNVAATYTQTVQRRGGRHEGFVQRAQQGGIDLLLHGDSITDFWALNDDNRAMFDKYFAGIKTANFAISGDTTQGVLWGLHNGEGQGFQPKAVMLMIGTNNTAANTAPEIAEGIGAVILEMRHDFPDAKILLLAVFPRGVPGDPVRDRIAETNRIISKLDDQKHVFYLDIGQKFLDEKGAFLPDSFRPDNLHPLAKGYDIWGEAVQATLAKLLQ